MRRRARRLKGPGLHRRGCWLGWLGEPGSGGPEADGRTGAGGTASLRRPCPGAGHAATALCPVIDTQEMPDGRLWACLRGRWLAGLMERLLEPVSRRQGLDGPRAPAHRPAHAVPDDLPVVLLDRRHIGGRAAFHDRSNPLIAAREGQAGRCKGSPRRAPSEGNRRCLPPLPPSPSVLRGPKTCPKFTGC